MWNPAGNTEPRIKLCQSRWHLEQDISICSSVHFTSTDVLGITCCEILCSVRCEFYLFPKSLTGKFLSSHNFQSAYLLLHYPAVCAIKYLRFRVT
jgi:hypothetical protein